MHAEAARKMMAEDGISKGADRITGVDKQTAARTRPPRSRMSNTATKAKAYETAIARRSQIPLCIGTVRVNSLDLYAAIVHDEQQRTVPISLEADMELGFDDR